MKLVASMLMGAFVAAPVSARADDVNWLVGPVLGIRLGGPAEGSRAIYGIEGGVGLGPERANVGFTRRLDETFVYAELDPWLYVGGTLGVGAVAETGQIFPVLGVWEGIPLVYPACEDEGEGEGDGMYPTVTLAGGYRWTGVHELYVTMKAGRAPNFCIY